MSIEALVSDFGHQHLPGRIWSREAAAFVGPDGVARAGASILNRLGWLDAPAMMPARLPEVEDVVSAIERDGLTDIYLLGMGGSSLCAEVLRDVRGAASGRRLFVLDTTDEAAIAHATSSLVAERACFLVASKSGSTLEVTSLERYFWALMAGEVSAPGRHFVAITDPDTELVTHAATRGYRHTFINPPDIGGRYSALSLFGLVPARLIGIAGGPLLEAASEMATACHANTSSNPGLALGVFMGSHAAAGRDKLTLLTSQPFTAFGTWVEQLVAESTGKDGRGILPVIDEPLGSPDAYESDRAFVIVAATGDTRLADTAAALTAAGHPVFHIETTTEALGAEFFRWEFATAVAGAVLVVNPFDEPDVRGAKTRTQAQLDAHRTTRAFNVDPPFEQHDGYRARVFSPSGDMPASSYLALLDYLPSDPARMPAMAQVRAALRERHGHAVTHGVGPRYLHSTGQYHKGGPNTGVFVLLTSADTQTTPVPGAPYTFSTLKQAQAFGDFDALKAAGRRVVHVHLDDWRAHSAADLDRIVDALLPR